MTLWLVAGLLSLVTVGMIALPLLRRPGASTGDGGGPGVVPADELASARHTLADIEARRTAGMLSDDEAQRLRATEARRLFTLTDRRRRGLNPARRVLLAGVLAVTLPLLAWATYSQHGVPGLPDLPMAGRAIGPGPAGGAPLLSAEQRTAFDAMSAEEQDAAIGQMVDGLAARLATAPDDVEGWLRLGRARLVQGRIADGQAAFAEAAQRAPDSIAVQLAYADSLLADQPADGAIPPALITVMERVLALDGSNPNALYVLGLAAARGERWVAAEAHWSRLAGLLPPDSAERAALEDALARIRQELP